MTSRKKVLLLVGGAWYHDQPKHRAALAEMLSPRFDVTMSGYPARTLTQENLAGFDVIADYTSWWEPEREECLALLEAVAEGKGYACLHPATGSFMNSAGYHDMIGASFVYHDPNKVLQVEFGQIEHFGTGELVCEGHPIVEGIPSFEVQDELFVVQGDMTHWHILARAEGHPVVWTKQYGKGRVFCTLLGHDHRALATAGVRALFVQGIEWAAGLR